MSDEPWTERAFRGRVLDVDLSGGTLDDLVIEEGQYRALLGGYGLGARLLFDRIPVGADPLGPDNVLGFFSGLLTGTPLFGQRFQVVAMSPKNGGWGDSSCGGDFGPVLKFAGYDGVLVRGQAAQPCYIHIEGGRAELRDATSLWGELAQDAERSLKATDGDRASVVVIGPAGEQRSLMAGIANDGGRMAARSGLGAVMGSKRLKAIVAVAPHSALARTPAVLAELRDAYPGFGAQAVAFYREHGTAGIAPVAAISGDAPVKNWRGVGIVDLVTDGNDPAAVTGPALAERMERSYACWHCHVACGAVTAAPEAGAVFDFPAGVQRPQFETVAAFGALTSTATPEAVDGTVAFNHWCNAYGLDTISTGATIAFAIECYEAGLITLEDTDGLRLAWGDAEAILALTHRIGRRDGIGDVLADGVQHAAARLGPRAEAFAMHVDGEEVPMHDPKYDPGYGAAYLGDATPARHTLWAAGRGDAGTGDRRAPRGQRQRRAHESAHVMNATGICSFVYQSGPMERLPQWIQLVTGWDVTAEELREAGERIGVLRLAFALRHGNNPAARVLPGRVSGEPPQRHGPNAGVTVDAVALRDEWFEAAGWDPVTSLPSRAKLDALGLSDVADALSITT